MPLMGARAIALALWSGLSLSVATASAETASADPTSSETTSPEVALREARAALEELRYADALAAVERVGALAPLPLRVEAQAIGAVVHLLEGRPALAAPLILEVYQHAPGFLLDDASLPPTVTAAFDAEAAKTHTRGVNLELTRLKGDARGFQIIAGGETARVEVACRAGAEGPFLPLAVRRRSGASRFHLPGEGEHGCHAVALDALGLPLGRLGTAAAPITLRPLEPVVIPPPAPAGDDATVAESWWFWTSLVGAAATAAVTIGVVVVAARGEAPPTADVDVDLARFAVLRF
jgi:hypothetical protein